MSNGIGTAFVAGNISNEPALNDSGKVLSFGVAVNRREKDRDGEYADAAHFFDVKVLGNRAGGLASFLRKGMGVAVMGELVQERWEKDGQKRSAVRIIAREVVPFGGKGDDDESGGRSPVSNRSSRPAADDDIPF